MSIHMLICDNEECEWNIEGECDQDQLEVIDGILQCEPDDEPIGKIIGFC